MLKIHLPAKEENVILVRLSQIQRDLYTQFMDRFRDCGTSGWLGLNPLKAFCVCCKVSGALREWTESKGAHKSWGGILVGILGEGRLEFNGLPTITTQLIVYHKTSWGTAHIICSVLPFCAEPQKLSFLNDF